MKVFGWMADHSGCGYYRISMPFQQLRDHGVTATHATRLPAAVRAGDQDVVVGQRVCLPGPSAIWRNMAREGRSKLVFELDDDLWSIDPSNSVAYHFYNDERKKDLADNIACSDLVTVSTDRLAEVVSRWNDNVVVIPNFVPGWLLDWQKPNSDPNLFTLGWGGSPSHTRDFGEMARPLKTFLQHPDNRSDTEFHCIGPDFTSRVSSAHGRTRSTGWFPRVEPYLQAVDFDLGVIPLRRSVFNDSKSDIKFRELSALGVPVIASNTGPYARSISNGETGLLVSDHREWADSLKLLRRDSALRERISARAKENASTQTIEKNAHLWLEAWK